MNNGLIVYFIPVDATGISKIYSIHVSRQKNRSSCGIFLLFTKVAWNRNVLIGAFIQKSSSPYTYTWQYEQRFYRSLRYKTFSHVFKILYKRNKQTCEI